MNVEAREGRPLEGRGHDHRRRAEAATHIGHARPGPQLGHHAAEGRQPFLDQVGGVLVSGVEWGGEGVGAVLGLLELRGCEADQFARVGVVVGSDAARVVFVTQPAVELVEQLWQSAGHGSEVGEQLGRTLDSDRRTRSRDGDHEQRIGDLDRARQLMADVGRRRRVPGIGLAGDRAAVEQPLIAVEAEFVMRRLLSGPAGPGVAAARLRDADSARSAHGRRGDRRGRRTCPGPPDRPDRALVGEPDVAV